MFFNRLRFILPPPELSDPEENRRTSILYRTLIVTLMIDVIIISAVWLQSVQMLQNAPGGPAQRTSAQWVPILAGAVIGLSILISLILLNRRRVNLSTQVFLASTFTALTINAYFQGGIHSPSAYFALAFLLIAALLGGERVAYIYLASFAAVFSYLTFIEYRRLLPPPAVPLTPVRIWLALMAVFGVCALFIHLILRFNREVVARIQSHETELAESNAQLRAVQASLEERVGQRTAELERRARQLQAAAEVGRAAATLNDLEELLAQATRLIGQQFDFYHVGLFLLDRTGRYAELRAASSLGGQEMLTRGHRLEVGGQSVVGSAAASRQPRISQILSAAARHPAGVQTASAVPAPHQVNPDLPDTQSEMALPLVVLNQVIGVLDVQSTEPAAFSEEDMATLQILADQLAVAINNARLITETQSALEVTRRVYGDINRQAWRDRLQDRPIGLRRNASGLTPLSGPTGDFNSGDFGDLNPATNGQPARSRANLDPQTQIKTGGEITGGEITAGVYTAGVHTASIPIRVRGEVIGHLQAHKPAHAGPWSQPESDLLETLVEQLGIALDSARLHEETRERAELERLVAEATAHMRATLDIEAVLQTAAREMRRALDLSEVDLRLGTQPKSAASTPPAVRTPSS